MRTADWYRKKADECVALAKTATLNEERARHYALADHYMRLARDALNPPKQQQYRDRSLPIPAAGS